MGNHSNCSVVFTLFKVTFLGKWDECGERPGSSCALNLLIWDVIHSEP